MVTPRFILFFFLGHRLNDWYLIVRSILGNFNLEMLPSWRIDQYKEPVPLMGRSAILGEQRNNYFCDVGCGRGEMGDSTYAITKTGLLCEFNNRRLLDKWVELRVCHKPLSGCD